MIALRTLAAMTLALGGILALSAPSATAFDGTPISTLPLDGALVFGTIGADAVPGEPICGTDYTGEDFYDHQFTLTGPSLVVDHLGTGRQFIRQPMPDAEPFVRIKKK